MSPDLYWETPDEVLILNGTRYVREGEPVSELSPLDALAKAICDGDARCAYQWDEHSDAGHERHRSQARAALRHLSNHAFPNYDERSDRIDFSIGKSHWTGYGVGELMSVLFGIKPSEYADGAS